jgi:hypothetical protein
LEKLIELKPEEDELEAQLERMRAARDPNDFKNLLNNPNRPKPSNDDVQIGSDNSDNEATPVKPVSGRGSRGGRGRGSRGPRGARARGK